MLTEPLWQLDLYPMQESEQHILRFGGLGLIVLDNHGGRAWTESPETDPYPYLGTEQWRQINSSLGVGSDTGRRASSRIMGRVTGAEIAGALADVRLLLVLAPMPLVTVAPRINDLLTNSHDDFAGHWAAFVDRGAEQSLMLRVLQEWRAGAADKRQMLLVGGDIHQAGLTDILDGRSGELLLRQLVSSPISQQSIPDWQLRLLTFLCLLEDSLPSPGPETLRFHHYHVTRPNNYALVDLRPHLSSYRARLIASDPDDRRRAVHEHRFVEGGVSVQ